MTGRDAPNAPGTTGGERRAAALGPGTYDELRTVAAACLAHRARGPLLQTTVLVNEACVKLLGAERLAWKDEAHFLAIGARAIRQVLVDHVRQERAQKRGGDLRRVTLAEALSPQNGPNLDVLALDELLRRLAALDARQHEIVEMKFFAGMSIEQVSTVTGLSTATVEREWRAARAWLVAHMSDGGG